MVILDYSSADHDHVAVTREGFWRAIRFQSHFYVFNRSFSRLQEAVDSCRYDMDYGSLISIVVVRQGRFEVWSRVGSDIPVLPRQLLGDGVSLPAATSASPPTGSLFQRFWRWARALPVKAYLVDAVEAADADVDAEPTPRHTLFHHCARPYNALQA